MDRRKFASLNRSLNAILRQYETNLTLVVDNYLLAEVIVFQDQQPAYMITDWLNFCITKSCKSLLAIQILLKFKFSEDVLIILRSVYENYLSMVYILNHPENIDDFIQKPVGVKVGSYIHPKKGDRTNFRIIIDPETKEELPYGIGVSTRAKGSLYKSDFDLFMQIYAYLSELVHPHFMSSGNYRNEKKRRVSYTYSCSDLNLIFEAKFLTTYIFTLLLAEVFEIESNELEIPEMSKMRKTIIRGYEICSSVIELWSCEESNKEITYAMRSRLKEIQIKDWFLNW
jgi:hypothetical protein